SGWTCRPREGRATRRARIPRSPRTAGTSRTTASRRTWSPATRTARPTSSCAVRCTDGLMRASGTRRRRWDVLAWALILAAGGAGAFLLLRGGDSGASALEVETRSGDLMSLVRTLVDEMPRPGSHAYRAPTPLHEKQMATAFR